MFKFTYSKYNPWGLIVGGGGLYTEGVFRLIPKRPGDYTRWCLLSEFCGIFAHIVTPLIQYSLV